MALVCQVSTGESRLGAAMGSSLGSLGELDAVSIPCRWLRWYLLARCYAGSIILEP